MKVERPRVVCLACGSSLPGSMTVQVKEVDLNDLSMVVSAQLGDLDTEVCPRDGCGATVRVDRVVALRSSEQGTCLLVPTDERLVSVARETAKELQKTSMTTTIASDPASIRKWLSAWRWVHLNRFNRFQAMQAEGTPQAELHEEAVHWTPEFFAAMYAMAIAPPSGSQLGVASRKEDEKPSLEEAEALEMLASEVDGMVWFSWVRSALNDQVPLRETLAARIVPRSIRPSGIEAALVELESHLMNEELELEVRYSVAAVAAYVSWQCDLPVGFEQVWSALWLHRERWLVKEKRAPDARQVDPEMVAATTAPGSFLTILSLIARKDLSELPPLVPLLESVGRAHLAVMVSAQVFDAIERAQGAADAVRILEEFAHDQQFEVRLTLARALLRRADTDDWAALAWALAEALLDTSATSDLTLDSLGYATAQIRVEAWVGEVLKDHGLPDAFLARVGDSPRDWEADVALEHQFALAAERSNALRLKSRFPAAIEVLESMRPRIEASPHTPLRIDQLFLLRRNVGIIRRDMHDHEGALAELLALTSDATETQRTGLYSSLAVSYSLLQQHDHALEAAETALAWAGERAERGAVLALVAQCRSVVGDAEGAHNALQRMNPDHLVDYVTLTRVCVVLMNLELRTGPIELELAQNAWRLLDNALDGELAPSSEFARETMLTVRASRRTLLGLSGSQDGWQQVNDVSLNTLGVPSPEALVGLSIGAWQDGDLPLVHRLLDQLPAVLVRRYSSTTDVTLVAATTSTLQILLDRLVTIVLERGASTEFGRVLAELSRDLVGRAATRQFAGIPLPWDEELTGLSGKWTVLEWLESEDEIFCLLTTLQPGIDPATVVIAMPPSFDSLGPRLLPRLRYWRVSDKTEPFAVPGWSEAEEWARGLVNEHNVERLVIIEHERFAEVPWQVLFGPLCPVSSVPSLSTVLAARPRRPIHRLGAVSVPRYGDAAAVADQLESAARALVDIHTLHGARLLSGTDAEREACLELLTQSDLVAFFCHGVFDADSRSMAWLVAADGTLPPAGRFGAVPSARRHRITPSDCDKLALTPGIVLSAACSSGVARYAGVGEQIGIFGALRRSGTTSLIAPRWDVPAQEIIPILIDIAKRIVAGQDPVIATQEACREAARHLPLWIAWALFHQGMTTEEP